MGPVGAGCCYLAKAPVAEARESKPTASANKLIWMFMLRSCDGRDGCLVHPLSNAAEL